MKLSKITPFVFLLSITSVLTALPDYILPIRIPYKEWFLPVIIQILVICLAVLYRFKLSAHFFHVKNILIFYSPVLMMYLLEPVRYLFVEGRNPLLSYASLVNIVVLIVFIQVGYSLDKQFFNRVIKIYMQFSYMVVWCAIAVFCLLHLNLLSIESWDLPSFYGTGFHAKYNMPGATADIYSVPLFATVIFPDYLKPFGFISEFGTFSGLSYEPHIAFFVLAPAYILTFSFYRNTIFTVITRHVPFILFFMLSFSVAGVVALTVTLFVYFILTIRKKTSLFIIITSMAITIIAYQLYFDVIEANYDIFEYFIEKFDSRSGEESVGFISHIMNPSSFWGYGVFNIPTYYDMNYDDIGLLTTLLFALFYSGLCLLIVKCLLRRNMSCALVGVYFIVHSLKFPMHMILFNFPIFIMLLLTYSAQHSFNRVIEINEK